VCCAAPSLRFARSYPRTLLPCAKISRKQIVPGGRCAAIRLSAFHRTSQKWNQDFRGKIKTNIIIMQAITTKYLPATNHLGARVKATCSRGSLTIGFDYNLSGDAIHIAAASALIERFLAQDLKFHGTPIESNPWLLPFATGTLSDGSVAHVFIL